MSLLEALKKEEKIRLRQADFTWSTADKLFKNLEAKREKDKKDFKEIDQEELEKFRFVI